MSVNLTERKAYHDYDNVPTAIINVRGTKFETYWKTLEKMPELLESILSHDNMRMGINEYFFDRDPDVFKCLLNYCNLGEFHVPLTICGPILAKELHAWGITKMDQIEYCCLDSINSSLMRLENLKKFDDIFDEHSEKNLDHVSRWERFRHCVWNILDLPTRSVVSLIYAIILYLIVLGSLFVFITDTVDHPAFSQPFTDDDYKIKYGYSTDRLLDIRANWTNATSVLSDKKRTTHMNGVYFVTNSLLTMDIIARLIFCPKLLPFLLNPYTTIDILSLIPFYYNLIETIVSSEGAINFFYFSQSNSVVRLLSLSIGLRCFRILRHYRGLQVLLYTIKVSGYDLLLMMSFISLAVVVFSTLMFFAESSISHTKFSNIPMSFWWCIVTITTTGYGDMVPSTTMGYVVASICSLSGVLVIAFTVPILVNNFVLYYTYASQKKTDTLVDYARRHLKDAVDQVKKLKNKTDTGLISSNNTITCGSPIFSVKILSPDACTKSNDIISVQGQNDPFIVANQRYKYSIDSDYFDPVDQTLLGDMASCDHISNRNRKLKSPNRT